METLELMKARHSVRQYKPLPIEPEKRQALNALAQEWNAKDGTNIQIFYDEPTCFRSLLSRYGKFRGVENYIALVGKKSDHLEETLGFSGEALVLKAQELGLNTCWVALTHGKSKAAVRKGEKLVCLLALGYGENPGVPRSSKPLSQLCKVSGEMPEWFAQGMEAAMLAPTAMNQQKFCLELLPDGSVRAACGSGFYTKLDLGIVKYHFHLATGKNVR